MKILNHSKFIAVILFLIIISLSVFPYAFCENIKSSGKSSVLNGDIQTAKEIAIQAAKINAIRLASGSNIKSINICEKGVLTSEFLQEMTNAVIVDYKIIKESFSENEKIYEVEIYAEVNKNLIDNEDAKNYLKSNYSVLISIDDYWQNNNNSKFEKYMPERLIPYSEGEIIKSLKKNNFLIFDKSILADKINFENSNYKNTLLKDFCNVIIIGKSVIKLAQKDIGDSIKQKTDIKAYLVGIEVKIFTTDSDEILDYIEVQGKGFGNNDNQAAAEALKNAVKKLNEKITVKLEEYALKNYWKKDVSIIIENCQTLKDYKYVLSLLQNQRWVDIPEETLNKRNFNENNISIIPIRYIDKLFLLGISLHSDSRIEVTKINKNTITVKLK